MSAVHGHCQHCGKSASLVWRAVKTAGGTTQAKRLCAQCLAKLPATKPEGTVEK